MRRTPESPDTPVHSGLHGRHKGKKLRSAQSRLMEDLLPRLAVPVGTEPLDPAALFDFPYDALVVEIGFGGGEHIAHEAAANPNTAFIGCEPFVNGVAKLVALIDRDGHRNIRIHPHNALDLLARLPQASVDRVDLLYPDPWPKRRQRKRRFVSLDSLAAMARALKPGHELRFATDIDDYAAWTLTRVEASPEFEWRAQASGDWTAPWPGWRPTRFEERARKEGRGSAYLTFMRV